MRRFVDLLLTTHNQSNKVYGMSRKNQITYNTASVLSFGITWAEVDKIVFDLFNLTSDNNNILFCTSGSIYIGYSSSSATSFTFSGVTGSANLAPLDVTDGARHTVEFTVSSDSTKEITNTWDRSWAKQTGYISVEFWKNGNMLKQFVPSIDDAFLSNGVFTTKHMLDTVSGNKIQVSGDGYSLEIIQ